jgi:hypothetical protein
MNFISGSLHLLLHEQDAESSYLHAHLNPVSKQSSACMRSISCCVRHSCLKAVICMSTFCILLCTSLLSQSSHLHAHVLYPVVYVTLLSKQSSAWALSASCCVRHSCLTLSADHSVLALNASAIIRMHRQLCEGIALHVLFKNKNDRPPRPLTRIALVYFLLPLLLQYHRWTYRSYEERKRCPCN